MENEDVLEQMILDQDVRELYQAYKTCLNDNEKQVVRMRYGLFGGKEYTQREIAQAMGLSRSYISRIEKRGLEKIGKEMRKYKIFIKNIQRKNKEKVDICQNL